ncbi:hypothetical protein [Streptomyces sp. NPDC093544]
MRRPTAAVRAAFRPGGGSLRGAVTGATRMAHPVDVGMTIPNVTCHE